MVFIKILLRGHIKICYNCICTKTLYDLLGLHGRTFFLKLLQLNLSRPVSMQIVPSHGALVITP